MTSKIIYILIIAIGIAINSKAQDVTCQFTVNGSAIQGVEPALFKSLEQGLKDFINNRRWTSEVFENHEKIEINFNLTIVKKSEANTNAYRARLSMQSARPVYGTDYKSPIFNYVDDELEFRFQQFQNIEFNDNRVAGSDPLVANLTATIAFYIYYIIGLDYDSYSLKGGDAYYAKAQNIVNNAPEYGGIEGWKRQATKNRYSLLDNMLNSRFENFRITFYEYHRLGMDAMSTKPAEASAIIKNIIPALWQVNNENPNSALIFMYNSTKNQEYLNLLQDATEEEKQDLIPKMTSLDVTNASKYNALLK
jgi:hypothetical protein